MGKQKSVKCVITRITFKAGKTNRSLSGSRLCHTTDHQPEVSEACHITFKAVSDHQAEVGEACHITFKAFSDRQSEVTEACHVTFKAGKHAETSNQSINQCFIFTSVHTKVILDTSRNQRTSVWKPVMSNH